MNTENFRIGIQWYQVPEVQFTNDSNGFRNCQFNNKMLKNQIDKS